MIGTIKSIILDFQETRLETGVPRRLRIETVHGKAAVCIVVRRSGKSTYVFQVIQRLLDGGVLRQNILYLNFFDDRLHNLRQNNLGLIAEVVPGTRWCSICHTNAVNPAIGRLASPGKRLGALFLDLLIPVVAVVLASTVSVLGSVLLIAYVIWALVLFSRGATPEKKILGMRVVKEDGSQAGFGTMPIREWVGKWISGMIFGLGFLWILFDHDKQGWHDKLMNTYVIEEVHLSAA